MSSTEPLVETLGKIRAGLAQLDRDTVRQAAIFGGLLPEFEITAAILDATDNDVLATVLFIAAFEKLDIQKGEETQ